MRIFVEDGKLKVKDAEDVEALRRAFYGKLEKGEIVLDPEEALYLIDVRGAECYEGTKRLSFNELAARYVAPGFVARYLTYKDWRDRGLFIRPIAEAGGPYARNPVIKYPSIDFKPEKIECTALFFPDDRIAIVDDPAIGRKLYESYWLGQYGTYKAEEKGRLLKLDQFETLFAVDAFGLTIANFDRTALEGVLHADPDYRAMYAVYADWRARGFIVKTGFKFGTHFRIYFPGAGPMKKGEWVHSRHVIQVFPRSKRLRIAEWARAIRVAHSVRKTFILAIPGKRRKPAKVMLSYLLFHRKQGAVETPATDDPSFAMLSLAEDEMIGGAELADAIEQAKSLGLDLILAIADRETAVTHYRVKRIDLPRSKYEYYEVEWIQP